MPNTSEDEGDVAFESDPGSRLPSIIAGALVLALVLWFGSGGTDSAQEPAVVDADASPSLVLVAVRPSEAQSVPHVFAAEGQALPDREAVVFAETTADVMEVSVAKGEMVASETALAQFKSDIEEAQLRTATANLERAKRDAANAERLSATGAISEDRLVAVRASLAQAESQLVLAEEALTRTTVRSPFPGRVEELHIEAGELVAVGTPVARIVNLDPLSIRVRVPQQSLAQLETGQPTRVRFITGETREGTVSFIGSSADADTRTFELEVEVPNPSPQLPAGISAQVFILTGTSDAHFVSPATLALDVDGQIGLKAVDSSGVVTFHPVRIMRAEPSGVWVTGVPRDLDIITVGQGFVQAGQRVRTSADDQPAPVPSVLGIEQ